MREITVLTDDQVRRVLPIRAALKVAELTLRAAALTRAFGPLRSVLTTGTGWFATMPASVDLGDLQALGAKFVTAFPSNAARGFPTHHAQIVLLDPDTGVPLALVAGEYITEVRTAAMSVLATRALALRPRGIHAILGSGVQAHAHLDAFATFDMIESLHVWSRSRERAEALADRARALGIATHVFASAAAAAIAADVVTTVTAARLPLFESDSIAKGTHINAVGACVPDKRELPSALMARSRIYADSAEAVLSEAGDVVLAIADGALGSHPIAGELGALLAQTLPKARPGGDTTLFESVGLGILDVAAAAVALSLVHGSAATNIFN